MPRHSSPRRLRVDPETLVRGRTVAVAEEGGGVELLETGRLLRGVEVAILDEDGVSLPDGVVGEVAISSPFLFDGYNKDPDRTAAVIRDGRWIDRVIGDVFEVFSKRPEDQK